MLRNRIVAALTILGGVGLAMGSDAAEGEDDPVDPETLLNEVEARWGAPEKRTALRSLAMKGKVLLSSMPNQGTFEELFMGAERARTNIDFGELGSQTMGTTGEWSWTTDPALGVTIKKGHEQGATKRLFRLGRLRSWKDIYAKAEPAGDVELDGKKHLKMRMIAHVEDGCAEESDMWYVDPESYVLRRIDTALPDLTSSNTLQMEYWFDGWKDVDGYLFPHKKTQVVGSMKVDYVYESIVPNAPMAPDKVSPPDDVLEAFENPSKATQTLGAPGEFSLKELPKQHTATIRMTVKEDEISKSLADMLPAVMSYISKVGASMAGPPFSRYHKVEGGTIDLEAGIPVMEPIESGERVKASTLPAGDVAVTVHQGPYAELSTTHDLLEKWIESEGFAQRGGCWEIYWTDPGIEPDPKDWRTEVLWPIKEK